MDLSVRALVGTERDLTILTGNDVNLSFKISDGAIPYNFTSDMSLNIYLQATDGGSTAYSTACTVSAALLGEFTVTIAAAHWSGVGFYHIDLVDSSSQTTTLVFGIVNILSV